jgi:hypothetical protein
MRIEFDLVPHQQSEATGAKDAGTIVGLPESPITSVTLEHGEIDTQKA